MKSVVDKMASLYNIQFRTGCFCNTGACQKHLGISNMDVKKNMQAGHVCGDDMDLIDGQPTGSIRISFGYMSTFEDARNFLEFIEDSFVKRQSQFTMKKLEEKDLANTMSSQTGRNKAQYSCLTNGKMMEVSASDNHVFTNSSTTGNTCTCPSREVSETASVATNNLDITLAHIYLYPIKSCAAFEVSEWPVAEQGLLFDRNWMIVNENGVCLSQKQEPKLCLIHPSIDLKQDIMIIEGKGMAAIEIPLNDDSRNSTRICQNKVCGDRVHTYDCGEKIADWLYHFLNRKCRLIRQSSSFNRYTDAKRKDAPLASLSLVNEAQYLLINTASISHLSQQMALSEESEHKEFHIEQLTQRFRANLVINGSKPFEEEEWAEVFIDDLHLQVAGKCTRCQIICINQHTGERKRELFQTLSSCRNGKTTFGVYLLNSPFRSTCQTVLQVGSPVLFALKEAPETKTSQHIE
ncbi:hypothetical protein FKM82_006540 [Ascaphus truei]